MRPPTDGAALLPHLKILKDHKNASAQKTHKCCCKQRTLERRRKRLKEQNGSYTG
jgi:hypothetical protein